MIIVSACLAGMNCRWNGKSKLDKKVKDMVDRGEAIAVCPELLGGMDIPRKPAGTCCGLGNDVLEGRAKVLSAGDGEDMTARFIKGADECLKIAKEKGAKDAILMTPSPSCGCGKTWQLDGKFDNHIVEGDGVACALLKKNGIKVEPCEVK